MGKGGTFHSGEAGGRERAGWLADSWGGPRMAAWGSLGQRKYGFAPFPSHAPGSCMSLGWLQGTGGMCKGLSGEGKAGKWVEVSRGCERQRHFGARALGEDVDAR